MTTGGRGAIGAAPWGRGFGKCWAGNREQNSFPQDFSEPLGAVHTGPGGELEADLPQYLARGWDQTPEWGWGLGSWQKSPSPGREQRLARALQLPEAAFTSL